MFYIKLKDGREITTDMNSDDRKEFHTLIETSLGDQAAELFEDLLQIASSIDPAILGQYKKCIHNLEKIFSADEIDRTELEEILAELKDIYIDLT